MCSIGLGALNPQAQNWRDMIKGRLGKPILNLDFLLDKVGRLLNRDSRRGEPVDHLCGGPRRK